MRAPVILLGFLFLTLFPANSQTTSAAATAANPKSHKKDKPVQVTDPDGTVPTITIPKNPKKPYQPRCSTEIVNGNCYININRLYPYSYPGFMMKPHSSVTVNVFSPYSFEKLTLEPSAPANIYESTDQFGSLVTAITPGLKNTSFNGTSFSDTFLSANINSLAEIQAIPEPAEKAASRSGHGNKDS